MLSGSGLPFLASIIVVITLYVWYRWRRARDEAESWLRRNKYRVRAFRTPLIGTLQFSPRLWRNSDNAQSFRVEVDDLTFGGTGIIWLRVWTDMTGTPTHEIEVNWEQMPSPANADKPAEAQWADVQVELLRRVAAGETIFRSDARDPQAAEKFDLEVEHLLALGRRGLVRCTTPVANVRGISQYASVTVTGMTKAGERELERVNGQRVTGERPARAPAVAS